MFTSTDHDKLQQLMASSPENRALIETYGQRVDFEDLRALEPILQAIPR